MCISWQERQLKSWYNGSNTTINYGYNADGIRTYKEVYDASTATTTRHEYLLSGSQIVKETVYVNGTESYTLVYLYDETGSPIGYRYRTPSYASGVFDGYFYEKNLQGDIIKVFNQSGTQLANYIYDAWGNPTITYLGNGASTPAKYNPFAYRGYYLDIETGLYYVSSRYYDPEIGRWINADDELSEIGGDLRGYNLFAYCFNNPVNMDDHTGNWPKWLRGAINVVSGTLQITIGSALGATVSWTGFGAVAAGFLLVNGSATVVQGVGQIINDTANSEVLREDNIVRTGVQKIGKAIGGDVGARITGAAYDAAVIAASLYAGKIGVEKAMPNIIESKIFSANFGYGIKIGKSIEMFYRNPNAAGGPGGTIFSYKGLLGKFRIDWDPAHGFHCHPPGH